jgi:ubiquinone biosynthesis protein UbiJ
MNEYLLREQEMLDGYFDRDMGTHVQNEIMKVENLKEELRQLSDGIANEYIRERAKIIAGSEEIAKLEAELVQLALESEELERRVN